MNQLPLPKSWEWKRLGEIATKAQYGLTAKAVDDPKGYIYLRITDIDDTGHVSFEHPKFVDIPKVEFQKYRLLEGDVLIARSGSVGKSHLFRGEQDAVFASYLIRIQLNHAQALPEYVNWFLKSPYFWDFVEANKTLGLQPNLNAEKLKSLEIPLPPLDEQRRIVARIEELTSRIEEAKVLRRAAREEAATLLPSALHDVFSRAEQEGWERYTIGKVCTMKTGTTPPSKKEDYYGGDIPWFCPGDLGESKLLLQSSRTITQKAIDNRKARVFEGGTVLLVTIGATLGKVGLAPKTVSSNQQITGLLFNNSIVPDYAYWWLRSQYDNLRETAPAATLPILNQQALGSMLIAVPPLDEQRRIVAYLDGFQAKVEALRRLQDETQAELDALTTAILDKAFRGELSQR